MAYAIEMLNITKDFPGIRANDNVTLQVEENTVHALLGEMVQENLRLCLFYSDCISQPQELSK